MKHMHCARRVALRHLAASDGCVECEVMCIVSVMCTTYRVQDEAGTGVAHVAQVGVAVGIFFF